MNQEPKPAGADPAENIEQPSHASYQILRDAMAESALAMAEEDGQVEPSPDPALRQQQALRELKTYLQESAAAARRRRELSDMGGAPLLRQADILPPLSFAPELSDVARPGAPYIGGGADTETLLNGLIAECHFLMREVAFRTICDSRDPVDRVRFLEITKGMMRAGATVGDSVARLRHGAVKQIRQSFVHEEMQAAPPSPAQGEGVR